MTMRCRDTIKLIHEELDGTASAESRARLHEHLHACANCAQEYEALSRQEALLREADPDEPEDAYFDAMARSVAFETRKRERKPVGRLVPSWAFSSALAAACLLIGLSVGHVALPKTITRTDTVVRWVTEPGRVREVPVERVVVREVRVPVEVVRTRTVVERAPTAAPARPAVTLVAETPAETPIPAASAPTTTLAVAYRAAGPTDGLGIGARPAAGLAYGTTFATLSTAHVTSSDLRMIASRLRSDMSSVDAALGTPTLAATLATDMGRAEAEMDRSLRAAP